MVPDGSVYFLMGLCVHTLAHRSSSFFLLLSAIHVFEGCGEVTTGRAASLRPGVDMVARVITPYSEVREVYPTTLRNELMRIPQHEVPSSSCYYCMVGIIASLHSLPILVLSRVLGHRNVCSVHLDDFAPFASRIILSLSLSIRYITEVFNK